MKTPHKHAELIKAWADGAEIEKLTEDVWLAVHVPLWNPRTTYRIKPEVKPDYVYYGWVNMLDNGDIAMAGLSLINASGSGSVKYTFDGETRKLIKAEVLK